MFLFCKVLLTDRNTFGPNSQVKHTNSAFSHRMTFLLCSFSTLSILFMLRFVVFWHFIFSAKAWNIKRKLMLFIWVNFHSKQPWLTSLTKLWMNMPNSIWISIFMKVLFSPYPFLFSSFCVVDTAGHISPEAPSLFVTLVMETLYIVCLRTDIC